MVGSHSEGLFPVNCPAKISALANTSFSGSFLDNKVAKLNQISQI